MKDSVILGVDIGGSHITAMPLDIETGKLIEGCEVRKPVDPKGSCEEIISLWTNVIHASCARTNVKIKKIGIAMPGPFDYTNGIAWMKDQNKYDALYGLNVKELLANSLDIAPENICFINDAESFLKGEVFIGAARGASKAIGLTFGTGLGSARFADGVVEDADLWNSPFLDGIAEDYLSTRWFVSRYSALAGTGISGVKALAALAGKDAAATEVFKEFGNNLALFIEDIIRKDHPGIIVLGGNISKAFDLFSDGLKTVTALNKVQIRESQLGEKASLIGAASSWIKTHHNKAETMRA